MDDLGPSGWDTLGSSRSGRLYLWWAPQTGRRWWDLAMGEKAGGHVKVERGRLFGHPWNLLA